MPSIHLTMGAMFTGKSTALLRAVRIARLQGRYPLVVNHSIDTRDESDTVCSHTGDSIACVKRAKLMPLIPLLNGSGVPKNVACQATDSQVSIVFECDMGLECKVLVSDIGAKRTWVFRGSHPQAVLDEAARVVDMSSDGLLRMLASATQLGNGQFDTGRSYDCVFVDEGQFFPDLFEFGKTCADDIGCDVHVFGLDGDFRREKFGQILDLIPLCDSVEKLVSVCGVCKERPGLFSQRLTSETGQVLVGNEEYVQACRECFLKAPPESI
jgi:thymidine kinase